MEELKYGMEGYAVQLLQYALGRAGHDAGNMDGIFGRRTARALQQFQRAKGVAPDGVAGRLTWAALYPYLTGYTLHRVRPGDDLPRMAVGDIQAVPLDMPVIVDGIPWSGLMNGLVVRGLAARWPFLKVREIGRSVMGRPLLALSIGRGKRQVGHIGPHRADGWRAALMLLRFLEAYAEAYARNGSMAGVPARELFQGSTLHALPLVNPDGTDLVTGALSPSDSFHGQASALAAHYPTVPFPDGWRSNIIGIDLSFQYPTNWEADRRRNYGQGYTRPGPVGYVGSGPMIAPEVRALVEWTRETDFALALSFDGGYGDWFRETRLRPSLILDPTDLTHSEEIFRVLVRSLMLSP